MIEEVENEISAFEIKWNLKERGRFSHTFTEGYPSAKTATITPANLEEFVLNNGMGGR